MSPAEFFKDFMMVWFAGLGALVSYRILTRRISVAGLLTVDGHAFSPSRLQLLVVTASGLAVYATSSLSAHAMQPIPDNLVALFGLSHATYIGAKARLRLFSKDRT